jgi:Nif-specific regulatory protein
MSGEQVHAKLIVLAGPLEGAFFVLTIGEHVSVGRAAENVLPIDDHSVSALHCEIGSEAGHFHVRDLDSGTGTFVNRVPVRDRRLAHGDQIQIGNSLFLFLLDNGELPYGAAPNGSGLALSTETQIEHSMVGESAPMRKLYRFIAKVAPTDSTVLLWGESGTGKELAARAAINCAALTPTLLESELFGHEKGAFTGAVGQKKGRLEVADGGTVFLDEIAELDLALQAKLLRVLQEREFERVGGTRTVHVDIRLVAATNKDLQVCVDEGTFRRDLYYRLNVVSTRMPALRERREDIPLLASYFIARHNTQGSCRRVLGLSPQARAAILDYDWPGNVRELENAIERAVVLGAEEMILPEDLPEAVLESTRDAATEGSRYHEAVRQAKRGLILDAVQQAGGNYTEAARFLGLHPNYLHRLIRNLDLKKHLPVSH